ncbi:MAG TPA: hypothetical protein VFW63_07555, partial [Acidimicrobiales bacterium]|nr:hypothetical protein [Acidimicrobiales bacterium]
MGAQAAIEERRARQSGERRALEAPPDAMPPPAGYRTSRAAGAAGVVGAAPDDRGREPARTTRRWSQAGGEDHRRHGVGHYGRGEPGDPYDDGFDDGPGATGFDDGFDDGRGASGFDDGRGAAGFGTAGFDDDDFDDGFDDDDFDDGFDDDDLDDARLGRG